MRGQVNQAKLLAFPAYFEGILLDGNGVDLLLVQRMMRHRSATTTVIYELRSETTQRTVADARGTAQVLARAKAISGSLTGLSGASPKRRTVAVTANQKPVTYWNQREWMAPFSALRNRWKLLLHAYRTHDLCPVTQEAAGSSPVAPARTSQRSSWTSALAICTVDTALEIYRRLRLYRSFPVCRRSDTD